jgi:DNA-binding response OmpR family regulator
MTASHATDASNPPLAGSSARQISVLLFSDDVTTRDTVRVNVGRRPARDVEVTAWRECATAPAVIEAVEAGGFDVLILDGESAPIGGLGLCRQLKSEIFNCPPVLVLTGRPQDGWLATWSLADLAVPHPLDPIALANAVAELARHGSAATA